MSTREERLAALLASAERMAGGDAAHRAEISPAHDELDALAFALNVVVGELRYSTEQAAERQRLAAVGQLASGVAHEIRNPLAAILNATAVLRRVMPADRSPDVERSLAIIQEEVQRANAIVGALLEVARHRAPERHPTSLAELVDRVVAEIPPSITVRRDVEDEIPLVDVDGAQLQAAVANLVASAIESMPDGGNIRLFVAMRDGGVVIGVEDDGKGAVAPMGVGLGLLAAKTIVEAHGGALVALPCESGAGSCFEIRLPRDISR